MEVIKVYFQYSGTVNSDLGLIKSFIEGILVDVTGFISNKDTMFDIRLILNELIINGALHGNKCISSKGIKLFLEIKDDQFKVQVEDEGKGVDLNREKYNPDKLSCCGRGLVLVSGLSDELYIEKNKVTAIKHLN